MGAKLGVEVPHVRLDGVRRQVDLGRDLWHREVGRQVAEDAALTLAERLAQSVLSAVRRCGFPSGQQVQNFGDQRGVRGATSGMALEQSRRRVDEER